MLTTAAGPEVSSAKLVFEANQSPGEEDGRAS